MRALDKFLQAVDDAKDGASTNIPVLISGEDDGDGSEFVASAAVQLETGLHCNLAFSSDPMERAYLAVQACRAVTRDVRAMAER